MDEFLEKWRSDKKYQAKVKLAIYLGFIIIVTIFAYSQRNSIKEPSNSEEETTIADGSIVDIPNEYSYIIDVYINDKTYTFTGSKNENAETIVKTTDEAVENFILRNNEYYKEINGSYYNTTKNAVYNPIDYDYINLENINLYLAKARPNSQGYIVYLKDIILNNSSDEYFVITVDASRINIDYTPLMKQMDSTIYKYVVNIQIIKEWKRWASERRKK